MCSLPGLMDKCAHYLVLSQMCSLFGLMTIVLIIWPYDKSAHYLALRQKCSLFGLTTNVLIIIKPYEKCVHYLAYVLITWTYGQMCSLFGLITNVLIIWPCDKCAHFLA